MSGVALEILLDEVSCPAVIFGLPEESDGATIRGLLRMTVQKAIKADKLSLSFHGKMQVSFGNYPPERAESQTLIRQNWVFWQAEGGKHSILLPCIWEFPFEVHLPGNLPTTIRSKHGCIEYKCVAILARPFFRSDISTVKVIPVYRCGIEDWPSGIFDSATSYAGSWENRVRYDAKITTVTFREGGDIQAEMSMHLQPDDVKILSIDYTLTEMVEHRARGTAYLRFGEVVKTEESLPLGESTFIPEKDHDWSQAILFRIPIPEDNAVKCDVISKLINITHRMRLTFTVEVTEATPSFYDVMVDRLVHKIKLEFPVIITSITSPPPEPASMATSSRFAPPPYEHFEQPPAYDGAVEVDPPMYDMYAIPTA